VVIRGCSGRALPLVIAWAQVLPFLELEAQGPQLPIVASLPHSGTFVPEWLAPKFEPEQLEALWHSDWFLGELYDFLPSLGVHVIAATHSRYVADLNRPEALAFGDFWKAMVAEKTAGGRPVFRVRPTSAELARMRDEHHRPYHERLGALLDQMRARFGRVILLDLHSFLGLIEDDVCLGNASGATSGEPLMAAFESGFQQQGFGVVRNRVFTGGHITRHYGARAEVEALQIELRYTCYHDCTRIEEPVRPTPEGARIDAARVRLRRVFDQAIRRLAIATE
jgi:N-formylglutamate deformylase